MQTMERRKITYRLYPSKTQGVALKAQLRSHQQLYNAALEQRISAWRRRRVSVGYADQCKELTDLRRECPEFADVNCSSQQRTLRRLVWGADQTRGPSVPPPWWLSVAHLTCFTGPTWLKWSMISCSVRS